MTQYLVIRTDKNQQPYIHAELSNQRLRQGWGYRPEQDLRKIAQKRARNQTLTPEERDAWGSRRMLETEWNGLQPDDLVLCPNLPGYGQWILARVTGTYSFDEGEPDSGDYRHCLPVEPLRTPAGEVAIIHPHNAHVDARLRQTMRNMRRMWGIDYLANAVERLCEAIATGADVRTPHAPSARHEAFFSKARASIVAAVWAELQQAVQGAELESLLVPVLEFAYGKGQVEAVGGRGEKGADIMVNTRGPRGLRFRTAIQVKMHDGTQYDDRVVAQLAQAHRERNAQAGVLLTTAEEISPDLEAKLTQLSTELDIDIQAWTREDVVRLLTSYLFERTTT